MPPGGHVDSDETPEETAKRECKEETGLDVEILGEEQRDLFALAPAEGHILKKPIAFLLENIPESKESFDSAQDRHHEPAHQHMDFLYIAKLLDEKQIVKLEEREGREARWFTRDEIAALDPQTEIFANVQEYILRLLSHS
jgi:8-oxo-dGTP pyrophosphatase MutT (NUDIX family)